MEGLGLLGKQQEFLNMVAKRLICSLRSIIVVDAFGRFHGCWYFAFAVALQFLPLALKAEPVAGLEVRAEVVDSDVSLGQKVGQPLGFQVSPRNDGVGHVCGGGVDCAAESDCGDRATVDCIAPLGPSVRKVDANKPQKAQPNWYGWGWSLYFALYPLIVAGLTGCFSSRHSGPNV